MRTFSALRKNCAYPELIDLAVAPSRSRTQAADIGTEFHAAVEAWVKGQPVPALTTKESRGWLAKMEAAWSPPPGCESEIALGITDQGAGVPVDEPEPHVYVPRHPSLKLITAGRLDLRWQEDGARVVVDVKTGRTYYGDPWEVPQLRAQAVAEALFDGSDQPIRLGIYYAKTGMFDWGETRAVTHGDYLSVRAWAEMSPDPNPGGWCLGCWSASNCASNPAR